MKNAIQEIIEKVPKGRILLLTPLLLIASLHAGLFGPDKCPNATIDFNECSRLFSNLQKISNGNDFFDNEIKKEAAKYVGNCECWDKKGPDVKPPPYNNTYGHGSRQISFSSFKRYVEDSKNINFEMCNELFAYFEIPISFLRTNISPSDFPPEIYIAKKYVENCGKYGESEFPNFPIEISEKAKEYVQKCDKYSEMKTPEDNYYEGGYKKINFRLNIFGYLTNGLKIAEGKKESASEIKALIEKSGAETNFVLDKCNEYIKTFKEDLQVCSELRDSINLAAITALLKANELEESINACAALGFGFSDAYGIKVGASSVEKFENLCKNQLPSKVKKLPLKKINSQGLAEVYFSPFLESTSFVFQKIPKNSNVQLQGKVIQNDGKKAMLELTRDYDFIVKHSGQCFMREETYFHGFGKYLGEETYTTIFGARRTLPSFQLLWCPE